MKILFISNLFTPHVRGGYELGAADIAAAFHRAGHNVCMATSHSLGALIKSPQRRHEYPVAELFEPVFGYEHFPQVDKNPIWHQQHRANAMGGIIPSNCLALDRWLAENPADVVWIFNPLGLGPVGIIETALGRAPKVILHCMDNIDGIINEHQAETDFRPRYRRLKRDVTAVSCSTRTLKDNELLGTFTAHHMVPNGIDFSDIGHRLPKPCHNDEIFRFVYFGQIEEHKGLRSIVRAAAHLRDNSRPFVIDLIGNGSQQFRSLLQAEIARHNLENIIRLAGPAPKPGLLASLASYHAALLLLGNDEAFGYVVLEAVGAGLPTITTTGSGAAACLPDSYPFFVYNRLDSFATAKIMSKVMSQHETALRYASDLLPSVKARCDFPNVLLPRLIEIAAGASPHSKACSLSNTLAAYYTSFFASLA